MGEVARRGRERMGQQLPKKRRQRERGSSLHTCSWRLSIFCFHEWHCGHAEGSCITGAGELVVLRSLQRCPDLVSGKGGFKNSPPFVSFVSATAQAAV